MSVKSRTVWREYVYVQDLINLSNSGYDRFTDQTDKSADFARFADYQYYDSINLYIGSADYGSHNL